MADRLDLVSTIKDCNKTVDRISELPDDILLSILSSMGMKEAATTSILSKRWRYLWAKRTHLDFNHLIVFPENDPNAEVGCFTAGEKSKYRNWVNQVVGLHCGPCIDTFRVWFIFDSDDARHIDKWVRFAILKKVKNLELNLISMELDILKPSLADSGSSFLMSLHLTNINVSGDLLEYFLSRCRLLERLYVEFSETLVTLKVVGLSCKLKQLTIRCCRNLKEFEIDAVNLTYLEYYGLKTSSSFELKSVPLLVEAVFGGWVDSNSFFQKISHLAAQISKLSLNLFNDIPAGVFPTFYNLKQLNMLVDGMSEFDLVSITQFLEACPVLHEFKLEISWHCKGLGNEAYELQAVDVEAGNVLDLEYLESVVQLRQKTHQHLKVLQVVGFNGCNADVDLILYFVGFACNLENIICDPNRCSVDSPEPEIIEASRSRAGKLMKRIPPKISVVII